MISGIILGACGIATLVASTSKAIFSDSNKKGEKNTTQDSNDSKKMTRKLTKCEFEEVHYSWWTCKSSDEQSYIIRNDDYLRDIPGIFDKSSTYATASYISRIAADKKIFIPKYAEQEMRKFLKA